MGIIIITNNDKILTKYKNTHIVDYENIPFKDVLIKVRNKIHEGYVLISHPLSSSIKPNETPFKSVIISAEKRNLDYDSLMVIENSIATCDKFSVNRAPYSEDVLNDFKIIDLNIIESALL